MSLLKLKYDNKHTSHTATSSLTRSSLVQKCFYLEKKRQKICFLSLILSFPLCLLPLFLGLVIWSLTPLVHVSKSSWDRHWTQNISCFGQKISLKWLKWYRRNPRFTKNRPVMSEQLAMGLDFLLVQMRLAHFASADGHHRPEVSRYTHTTSSCSIFDAHCLSHMSEGLLQHHMLTCENKHPLFFFFW